jgi:hypothetical protein
MPNWVIEAYQNVLTGQSLAGHDVESPITGLRANVSQPYSTLDQSLNVANGTAEAEKGQKDAANRARLVWPAPTMIYHDRGGHGVDMGGGPIIMLSASSCRESVQHKLD